MYNWIAQVSSAENEDSGGADSDTIVRNVAKADGKSQKGRCDLV